MNNLEVISNKNAFGEDEFCDKLCRHTTKIGEENRDVLHRKHWANLLGTVMNLSACAERARRLRGESGHKLRSGGNSGAWVHNQVRRPGVGRKRVRGFAGNSLHRIIVFGDVKPIKELVLTYFILLLHFLRFVHKHFEVNIWIFVIRCDNEVNKLRYWLLI